MNLSTPLRSKQEYFPFDSIMITEDSIDAYLDNPNFDVLDMIEQYDVPMINREKKTEKKKLLCAVCGATASGYNFDQVSCESCKAFFRRNALRDINELRCRFSGNCSITIETRRHCPYCRIKKCFAVGMRKEWIRSEEEKISKRLLSERNRRRKSLQQQQPEALDLNPGQQSNYFKILTPSDRIRLSNITHCYDQFFAEPSVAGFVAPINKLSLRIDELFNRKRPIYVNFVSYFKHLPESQTLDVDDQVSLIKHNIRLIMPLNYAVFRTPSDSQFRNTCIQTIGCQNNVNLHEMLRNLADSFTEFVSYDYLLFKLFIIVLFYTTGSLTTRAIYDPGQYKQFDAIKKIQSSYMELLWLYMLERYGEEKAVSSFTRMISKYLRVQLVIDQIDSIVHANNDIENLDSLMKTMLQLT